MLPSGATPQRREFVYPRQLVKTRSRGELLESLRRQQEELQAAMEEEDDEEETEEEDKHSQIGHVRPGDTRLDSSSSVTLLNLVSVVSRTLWRRK